MPGSSRAGSGWRGGIFLLVAAFVVALDQLTKSWVRSNIALNEAIPVWGRLTLANVRNTGSAFGLFVNQAFLLTLIAAVGIVAILIFYKYFSKSNWLGVTGLSLVLGGAVGNLIDRIRFGYVTDFIDVLLWGDFHWPTFNVADSAITVGSIVLIFFILFTFGKSDGKTARDRDKNT